MSDDINRNQNNSQKSKPEKHQAEYGDINPHNRQGRAIRSAEGTRLSEHEHIRARINIKIQTTNPETGLSPYDAKAYREGVTITIPKDMADIKTKKDLELRDKSYDALEKDGEIPEELTKEMSLDADIERTIQSRDEAIEKRLQAGDPIDDLVAITDEKIKISGHFQEGGAYQRTNDFLKERPDEKPLRLATDTEIEELLAPLDIHESVARERVGSKINLDTSGKSNLNRLAMPRPDSNSSLPSTTTPQPIESFQAAESQAHKLVQVSSDTHTLGKSNLSRLAMPRPDGSSSSTVTNNSTNTLPFAEMQNVNPIPSPASPISLTTQSLSDSSSMSH
jgi:hypothetical protein